MKLDEIIEKYGMHELDIDFCQKIKSLSKAHKYLKGTKII